MKRRDMMRVGLRLALAPAIAWRMGVRSQAGNQPALLASASKESITAQYVSWLQSELALPRGGKIDLDLRDALRELTRAHVERMQPILRQWVTEEFAAVDSNTALQQALHRVNARFVNELALWRLQSPSPGYDAIWLRALQRPAACSILGNDGRFATQVAFMQAVPLSDRPRLLEGERWLFAQWGQDRHGLPARPEVSQAELVDQTISQIRAGMDVTGPAMPPVLAARLLRDKVEDSYPSTACARNQWGLLLALAQGGERAAQALIGYRYASMPLAADMLRLPPAQSDSTPPPADEGPGSYPRLATAYGVEGVTTLEIVFDGAGKFVSAKVVDRAITVPGLRGVRPVAFETVFDEAAAARAATIAYPKRDAAQGRSGDSRGRMDMAWKLTA